MRSIAAQACFLVRRRPLGRCSDAARASPWRRACAAWAMFLQTCTRPTARETAARPTRRLTTARLTAAPEPPTARAPARPTMRGWRLKGRAPSPPTPAASYACEKRATTKARPKGRRAPPCTTTSGAQQAPLVPPTRSWPSVRLCSVAARRPSLGPVFLHSCTRPPHRAAARHTAERASTRRANSSNAGYRCARSPKRRRGCRAPPPRRAPTLDISEYQKCARPSGGAHGERDRLPGIGLVPPTGRSSARGTRRARIAALRAPPSRPPGRPTPSTADGTAPSAACPTDRPRQRGCGEVPVAVEGAEGAGDGAAEAAQHGVPDLVQRGEARRAGRLGRRGQTQGGRINERLGGTATPRAVGPSEMSNTAAQDRNALEKASTVRLTAATCPPPACVRHQTPHFPGPPRPRTGTSGASRDGARERSWARSCVHEAGPAHRARSTPIAIQTRRWQSNTLGTCRREQHGEDGERLGSVA